MIKEILLMVSAAAVTLAMALWIVGCVTDRHHHAHNPSVKQQCHKWNPAQPHCDQHYEAGEH